MPAAPSRHASHDERPRAAHAVASPSHRLRTAAIAAGTALVGIAVLGGAALVVVPPVATNLSSETVAADTAVASADGAVGATLPAGWTVQHPFLRDEELTLRSPDGRLTVTLTAVAQPADAAFAALAAAHEGLGAAVAETLGSGLVARHAETADGRTVVAVLAGSGGGSVTAVAAVDADTAAAYRPAIAEVLQSVRVGA